MKRFPAFKTILLAACVALFTAACHHHDDPEPGPEPVAQQTLLMYMPWSGGGSIYNACLKNISAMKTAIEYRHGLGSKRVVVLVASTANRAYLIDLKYKDGVCRYDTLKTYSYLSSKDYTTESGVKALFSDVISLAEAHSYGMVVSAHGTGWLPAQATSFLSKQQTMTGWRAPRRRMIPVDHPIETRYYGTGIGGDDAFHAEIAVLRDAVAATFGHLDFLLFDNCYMQNIEVAYDLRNITDYIIGSTSEVMMIGMPFTTVGGHLLDGDYAAVVQDFYDFFIDYQDPYGTLSLVKTSEVEPMAALVKEANLRCDASKVDVYDVQALDGFSPSVFYDMGSYLKRLSNDNADLQSRLQAQLRKMVPTAVSTPLVYAEKKKSVFEVTEFSGITISDISMARAAEQKTQTAWWQATH